MARVGRVPRTGPRSPSANRPRSWREERCRSRIRSSDRPRTRSLPSRRRVQAPRLRGADRMASAEASGRRRRRSPPSKPVGTRGARRANRDSRPRAPRFGEGGRARRSRSEELLESRRVVERPDQGEIQALVLEEISRDAVDVLDRHLVETPEELVRLFDLALENLPPEAVLDRPLWALEPEYEASLRISARLL